MTTDADLLQHYATQKSEVAFAKLVQRHLALVYSTALRQLNGVGEESLGDRRHGPK